MAAKDSPRGEAAGLKCCESCQIYWTCETKWYRGEKNEENICCRRCNYHSECLQKPKNSPSNK